MRNSGSKIEAIRVSDTSPDSRVLRALRASFLLWIVASVVAVLAFLIFETNPENANAGNGDLSNGLAYVTIMTIGCLPLYWVCFLYWRKVRPPIDKEPQKWKRALYAIGLLLTGLLAFLFVLAVGTTEASAGMVAAIAWTVLAAASFSMTRRELRTQPSPVSQPGYQGAVSAAVPSRGPASPTIIQAANPMDLPRGQLAREPGSAGRNPVAEKSELLPPPPPTIPTDKPSYPDQDVRAVKPDHVGPNPPSNKSASPSSTKDYSVGDVIDDRFRIEGLLGEGGFSKVYRVTDTLEGAVRALKLFNSATGFEAVRREIGALRRARHPRIVEVFWFDSTGADEWYLVMEFIQGELLADYVIGGKQMPDRQAVDVAVDVLDALVAIHPDSVRLDELHQKKQEGEISMDDFDEMATLSENALVHRDIKPQNIMLTRTGAKLLDFNIASRVGDPVRTVSGTPPYQPPDADLTLWDVSTDLFAVGVTLYELVCNGNHPYLGGRPMGGVIPRPPSQFRRDLPDSLSEFLVKSCAPTRSDRFNTAAEMRAALASVRSTL